MTDRTRTRRGLAALALVPLGAGVFGGTVVWAAEHDPIAEPAATPAVSPTTVAPVATPPPGEATTAPTPTEVLLHSLSVRVAEARARVAELRTTLDEQTEDATKAAASAQERADAAARAAATVPRPAAPRAAAPQPAAPRPAPAPAVDTTTKASG